MKNFPSKAYPAPWPAPCSPARKACRLIPTDQADRIDLYVDGADEVSPEKGLIKGRGAAMVGEKLLAEACAKFLVIVDEGKLVAKLGAKFPVPVEVMPAALRLVQPGIAALGGKPVLRLAASGKDGPVVSDNGNLILDVTFGVDPDWNALDASLNCLPGVVGHGLFLRYAKKSTVLVRPFRRRAASCLEARGRETPCKNSSPASSKAS